MNNDKLEAKEKALEDRLAKIEKLEKEIKEKEKAIKQNEKAKKQIILRIAPSLWEDIARWAEEDFRSINGQIEFLLSECVRNKR